MIGLVLFTHLLTTTLATTSTVDAVTFAVGAAIIVSGGVGVVISSNPVHAALMLVMTLFGVAVLFVAQQANFLAAVQVIVYAGAIVVLFLFVIMFLGVDRRESLASEPIRAQRPIALGLIALAIAGLLLSGFGAHWALGAHSVAGPVSGQPGGDVAVLGRSVFTTYLFPFEATSALLVIAVVGAVVLARRSTGTARPGVQNLGESPIVEAPAVDQSPAVEAVEESLVVDPDDQPVEPVDQPSIDTTKEVTR